MPMLLKTLRFQHECRADAKTVEPTKTFMIASHLLAMETRKSIRFFKAVLFAIPRNAPSARLSARPASSNRLDAS